MNRFFIYKSDVLKDKNCIWISLNKCIYTCYWVRTFLPFNFSDDQVEDSWWTSNMWDNCFDQNILDQKIANLNDALCDTTSQSNRINHSSLNTDNRILKCLKCGSKFSNNSARKCHTTKNVCFEIRKLIFARVVAEFFGDCLIT